jgi:1-acyl-sn-glycerol-3-phosphate acyltransferase
MLSAEDTEILAIVVLFALVAVPVAWWSWRVRRGHFTAAQAVLAALSALLARTLWRARLVGGPLPFPPGQGAVIISNHNSGVDPWFIQLASDRVVHWMVAAEYYYHPALHWFFRIARSIPVSRGGIDTSAMKQAIRLAESGELVGLFPEGRINVTEALLVPGRPGAALIALRARVPVLPCYLADAPRSPTIPRTFLTPAKTRLFVGRPIDLSPYYHREKENGILQELTKRFLREIAALAGQPNFEPALAGRRWKPEENE